MLSLRSASFGCVIVLLSPPVGCGSPPQTDASGIDVADANDAATLDVVTPSDAMCTLAPDPFCTMGDEVPGASVPEGFCIRRFTAQVREPRTLSFAPNGDLFVGAPSELPPGGASGGPGAIVVLSDDNHDGLAELNTFVSGVSDVHGLAVKSNAVYFTTADGVWRTPYAPGQRSETPGARVRLATLPMEFDSRWTHGLAVDVSGRVLVSTGVFSAACGDTTIGHIDDVAGSTPSTVATGMRNPMYLRCHARDPICVASELGDDSGASTGAHERIFVVRAGIDFRWPSCDGVDAPACSGATCSTASREEVVVPLHDTPFGMDWAPPTWPAPFANALFVAEHGSFYSMPVWQDAGLYWIAADPMTHVPSGDVHPFAFGFGPQTPMMRRPADVAFSPDGRLFFADDTGGGVYWIAYAGCQR